MRMARTVTTPGYKLDHRAIVVLMVTSEVTVIMRRDPLFSEGRAIRWVE